MKRIIMLFCAILLISLNAVLADDSTFLCKQIDTGTSYILTGTSMVAKDSSGNFGKPDNASFGYMPDGKTRVWSLDSGLQFILIENQLIAQDSLGKVHGKIVCE
jgi:hypothetical protein